MSKKRFCLFAAVAALCVFASSTVAADQAIFGPGDFAIGKWHIHVRITTDGSYTFSVEVTDDQGYAFTSDVTVEVIDEARLDALLQDKWAGMKSALIAGDVERALQFHHERYHEKYTAIYNALGDELPTLAGQMQDISWICYFDGTAKYRTRQHHAIDGQIVTITYYIYFRRGENGLWFIEKY